MDDYLYVQRVKDIRDLKDQLKRAIADEQEAKSFYGRIVNTANKSGYFGIAGTMKAVLNQESQHEGIIRNLLKDAEAAEAKIHDEYEESKKKELVNQRQRGALPGRNI